MAAPGRGHFARGGHGRGPLAGSPPPLSLRRLVLVFLGVLVPVIGLVQVGAQSVADRYTYLPLVGVFIMACWGLDELTAGRPWRGPGPLIPLAAAVLLPAAWLTRMQLGYWSSRVVSSNYALSITGDNEIALANLGNVFDDEKKFDDALQCYYRGLKVCPNDARLHEQIAMSLVYEGKIDEAVKHFREELRLKGDNGKPHYDLGTGLQFQGKIAEAMAEFRTAIKMNPGHVVNAIPTATATNSCPVCIGDPLNLTGGDNGLAFYTWTGPNGYTSSDQNPTVSGSATLAMAGTYTLIVSDGTVRIRLRLL